MTQSVRSTALRWAMGLLRPLVVPFVAYGCALAVLCFAACATLVTVGVGLWLVPPSARAVVAVPDWARRRIGLVPSVEADGTESPAEASRSVLTEVWRCWSAVTDPRLWRAVWWCVADGTAGLFLAAVPAALVLYGLYGALVQPFVWRPIDVAGGSDWYTFIHVHTGTSALEAVPVAVCLVAVGLLVADPVASAGLRLSKSLLGEPRRNLQRRVEHLSRARGAAIDGEATRLHQIERDLHDGAQARLVAMGMTLAAAERLISTDPLAAQALVVEARDASSRALAELRDLVRGIHPPVLANRGLPDALRALAFDVPNPLVVVEDRDPCPRFSPPLEAALYFAAREAVTNAVKHAPGAPITITVCSTKPSLVRVAVRDEGAGRAQYVPAGGLAGIADRLAVFDGSLTIHSPPGGPTTVTLEVPCASC